MDAEAALRLLREVRTPEVHERLTDRETEVLRLLSRGLTNKAIAHHLRIGDGTLKTHVSSVLNKLGSQSRTQAALHAVRVGLVTPDEIGSA
jgi:DNA-binding NarL/FixJ family response regulator